MTPEIERLAKEAGFTICQNWGTVIADEHRLAKFAALVAESCAKEADALIDPEWPNDDQSAQAQEIASAIRAKFALSHEGK